LKEVKTSLKEKTIKIIFYANLIW